MRDLLTGCGGISYFRIASKKWIIIVCNGSACCCSVEDFVRHVGGSLTAQFSAVREDLRQFKKPPTPGTPNQKMGTSFRQQRLSHLVSPLAGPLTAVLIVRAPKANGRKHRRGQVQ